MKHSPIGCGTWPALWLSDPSNWPTNGEIDVMEQVNVVGNTYNQMTLHTAKGCSMKSVKRKEIGKVLSTSCVNSTDNNAGCGVDAGSGTFGTSFNSNGGAVVAMELRDAGIRMWQFTRGSVPTDVDGSAPDPSTWGEATADFPSTDCDIGKHFANQSIIADIDLCGSWAGDAKVYAETCKCFSPGFLSVCMADTTNRFWSLYRSSGEQQHSIHRCILGIREVLYIQRFIDALSVLSCIAALLSTIVKGRISRVCFIRA